MTYLCHYASPYYDPVKAHEYYMAHRVLKGKTSTSGLNDKGKEAASYVKNRLSEERKAVQERNNLERDKAISSETSTVKAQIAEHTKRIRFEISKLSILAKSKALQSDPEKRAELRRHIASLISENQKRREDLQNKLNTTVTNARESASEKNSKLADEYSSKYASEVEKMLKDPEFISANKTSKTKSSGTTKKSSTVKVSSNSSAPIAKTASDSWKSNWSPKKQIAYEKRLKKLAHADEDFTSVGEKYVGSVFNTRCN